MSITRLRVLEGMRPAFLAPPVAFEGRTPGAPSTDDEYVRHRLDSRRPGQAGSAAATRARLMSEIAVMENALGLTKRTHRDDDPATLVPGTDCA